MRAIVFATKMISDAMIRSDTTVDTIKEAIGSYQAGRAGPAAG